jgi:uncharacterized protein YqcC (DUF446 family)
LLCTATLVFVGWLGWFLLPKLETILARLFPTGFDENTLAAWAVAAIFVATGLAANAFRRQLQSVLRLA